MRWISPGFKHRTLSVSQNRALTASASVTCRARTGHRLRSYGGASSRWDRPLHTQLYALQAVPAGPAALLQVRVQFPADVLEGVGPQVVGLALLPPLLPLFRGHAGRGRRGALPDGQLGGGRGDGVHT